MRKIAPTSLLSAIMAGTIILLTPKSSLAQVDMSLLTEVTKSCQQDVTSSEYYEKLKIDISKLPQPVTRLEECIKSRYFHSLVLSKLPWLSSTGEMLPGYPGSAAISLMSLNPNSVHQNVLECIISQDGFSQECRNSEGFRRVFFRASGDSILNSLNKSYWEGIPYLYICPSCIVVFDNISSPEKMTDAFIKWFLSLDKPKRREVMSILGDETAQAGNRFNMNQEVQRAASKYREIRERVEQQNREQRKRDILGN